jgi:queuine tRNA-ribosyltransferase
MENCWRGEAVDAGSRARAGWLATREGEALPTPLFQPVATAGSVRTLDWDDLARLGYRHVLMNAYHLTVRPGVEALRRAGGVKPYTGWGGSVLSDSGGYQVYSLAAKRVLRQDGVRFTDHIAGGRWHFTPASVLAAQLACGVDFAMCLDVCTGLPATRKQVARDMALTHAWAAEQAALWPEISREQPAGQGQPSGLPARLFGIIQGGLEEDLRRESAAHIASLGFDGLAVGGLAVGEAREDFLRFTELTGALLPGEHVHYLMGVGEPADLLFAVAHGFDLFDCVQPARMGRHGLAYTGQGKLALHNARFTDDARPLDACCACSTCRTHSRAYLRHLLTLHEHSFARLLTLHNLALYKALMDAARERIVAGDYAQWWPERHAALERQLPEGM